MADDGALRELFMLDPAVHFLNHGSFGACPRPVFDVYQAWQRELERQPVEFLARRSHDLVGAARARLAAYLGADANDLVFVANATTGVNIIAHSLMDLLGPGDEVLTTDHEYGACDRTWRLLCARNGVTYRQVAIDAPVTTHDDFIETVWAGVGPRTRVLFLSHITSPTGLILPMRELCRRAREAGVLTLIDGAHALGQIPLDLRTIGADFYTGNCHKWLCGPKGAGFLHVPAARHELVKPLVISWGWEPEPEWPRFSRLIDMLQWGGTVDISAWLSVPAAIDFQREHGWDDVRARCGRLLHEARARLLAIPGVTALHPEGEVGTGEWMGQMEAVAVRGVVPLDLQRRLYDEHAVEVVVQRWNGRAVLRVSIQAYNTHADVDALVEGMEAVLGV